MGALSVQLSRYLLRPPVAQDRVRLRADGRVLVEVKTVWRHGSSHRLFEPIECMEKVATLIPRPAINVVVCAGALEPPGPAPPAPAALT